MRKRQPTVEDLEDFAESLKGPMGDLLRKAGVIMARRMERRGVEWRDLSDQAVMDLFHAAFLEAAQSVVTHRDRAEVEEATNALFASIAIELAANSEGSDAQH